MRLIQPVMRVWEKAICRFPFLVRIYSRPYANIVAREIEMAQITEKDIVLNVGCGSVPFTAIYIATMTGARVIAVDRDHQAVVNARLCVKALGLEGRIDTVQGDAAKTVPPGFSVAVVALQAEPKETICRLLLASGVDQARIVLRRPRPEFLRQYDQLPAFLCPKALVPQEKRTFDASVLYVK